MIALFSRRFVGLLLTLAVVSLLIFAVMDLLPGDPASIMLGTSASPETLAALRHDLGLDQPLLLRYGQWLAGVFAGDLGQSYTYGVPVAGLILERLAVTLPLALMAIVLSVAIAIPLGVLAAARRGGVFDVIASIFSADQHSRPGLLGGAAADHPVLDDARPDAGRRLSRLGCGHLAAVKALLMPAVALALPHRLAC
jgi:peptide/nickel transport system permease protein